MTITPTNSGPVLDGLGRLYRPIEAHRKLGIPRDRLYAAIHDGEIRFFNLGTPHRPSYLIAESYIKEWLERCAQGGQK